MKLTLKRILDYQGETRGIFEENTPMGIGIIGPWSDTEQSNKPIWREFFYWRLYDPKFNLLEVNIDIQTGTLTGIGIPLYNGELYKLSENISEGTNLYKEGTPCFDLIPWAFIIDSKKSVTKYFNYLGRSRLELEDNILRIVLVSEQVAYRISLGSSLLIEFNVKNELCGFVLKNLEAAEVAAIHSYVSKRKS